MPLEDSCVELFKIDGGLVVEASVFLTESEDRSGKTADKASEIFTALGEVAATAEDKLVEPLETMQVPFQNFIQTLEGDETWVFDDEAFTDAGHETIAICDAFLPETTAVEPEPASFEISGDYAADLAAQGMVPDSAQGFRDFMARQVCERAVDAPAPLTWERDITVIRGQPQITDDILRLTAAYDCPERSADLDELLGRLPADS
ncbi:hypothetical protein [Arthrobacter zhaoguopingii]|uniref:hypothetical protein n=1 Tax=Arthrobacter zhaoguopingii TaxID=2681491 RepID=UPI00135ABC52|nr:hypothetical protein [Arthrobacter zhaoguopingii]